MDIGTPFSGEGTGVTYPASLAQSRFWLLDALDPGTPALNVAVRWSLLGPISHDAVEAAMRRIVARHEILRTALQEFDGVPMQVIRPARPFQVVLRDLSGGSLEDSTAEADRIGVEEARTPFALETAPLIRVSLLVLAPGNARLLVTMHHVVCDGWSVGVLADELTRTLAGAPSLPELPLQYGDYAEWQQAWLQSPGLDAARDYWMQQLANLPYVTVPPDHAAEQRGLGTITSVLLPRALTDGMAATAVQQGCTQFSVALAALGSMLQSRTGAEDIAIGTQVAGRTETELEGMIGPFINTLVLRLDLSGAPDWPTRVARSGAIVADALTHHAMPFELLIRALNPARSQRRTPLFSVNFIFQRSFVSPYEGGGIRLVDLPSHSAGALYDLNFFMVERPDGWRASCEYDSALFDAATVAAMLADWTRALSGQPVAAAQDGGDSVLSRLSAIWCEILGLPGVAPADGFFDLGGHSLLAARMLARVEVAFGQRIGMAALFADSTLGGLAARLAPPTPGRGGTLAVAVGDPSAWAAVQETLNAQHAIQCVADSDPGPLMQRYPADKLVLLGAGADGVTALHLAQALIALGRHVTLVLLDAPPPPSRGIWQQLRGARSTTLPFMGDAVLFRRPGKAQDQADGWAKYLNGKVEIVALPAGAAPMLVAQRVAKALE